MKAATVLLTAAVWAGAEPLLEGRVRLDSGAPVPGAQVLLFDLSNLRVAPRAATTDGSGQFTLPLATLAQALPKGFELGANYPNPFNPSTLIPYQLPVSQHVRLEVFNLLGQRIATLVDGEQVAGVHTAPWDATDAAGQAVGAGVYLYRLSTGGVQATRRMLLVDGQAGIPLGGGGSSTGWEGESGGRNGEPGPVYGLTVSGPGLIPYVNPAFRLEAGRAPPEIVVEAPGKVPPAKAASSGGILGDVDNTGGVDFFDALLVALYSQDASIVLPNNGDISLGDVDADGQVTLTDAWLLAAWLNDPSDPGLPAGIGEPVGPAASLSPDPSTVTFADDGAWHRFTVEAGEPVAVVANPAGTTPRLEITTRSGRGNFCPAEADDDVSRQAGQAVYLAGCAPGTATVELRGASDGTVWNTYTFEVTGSPADLVVGSVSVSDSTLTPGQSFTLNATVRNQGTAGAEATTLRYYRSTNATISTRDTEVGTDPVGALGASRTSAESIRLTAPSSQGTYYYGACVVSVGGESAGNNWSTGIRVTVDARSPDLIVESVSVSDSILTPGQSFTLRATVRNQGSGQSAATTLRYYRSTNRTISTRDTQVGTDPVGVLRGSGTSAENIRLTAPSSEGPWYYGACVESVAGEADTGNNCSTGIRVTVRGPDLIVESVSVSDSTLTPGQIWFISATVRNQGTGAAAATEVRWHHSTDRTISALDPYLDHYSVDGLAASGTDTTSIIRYGWEPPSNEGPWYYGACVEPVAGEADTGNNCSLGVRVILAEPTPVTIPDPNLRAAIAAALGMAAQSTITTAEMDTLRVLDARGAGISDLTGLEFATSAWWLRLDSNRIADISPLAGCIHLYRLEINDNHITDLSPLAGLTNLRYLWIDDNNITDLSPLAPDRSAGDAGLINDLEYLGLGGNTISDLSPLAGLTSLRSLWLDGNRIADISPLAGCTDLDYLQINNNHITDLSPLAGLTELGNLWINDNNITDLSPVAGLFLLEGLGLGGNTISDLSPLAGLTNLTSLWLNRNHITDISPVAGLTSLKELSFTDIPVTDISPVAGLTHLTLLQLAKMGISDISALAGLTRLEQLNLNGNNIVDLSPLAGLTQLTNVVLRGNNIVDLSPLAGLTRLEQLDLDDNYITDISVLTDLPGLKWLYLLGNPLIDSPHIRALESRLEAFFYDPPFREGDFDIELVFLDSFTDKEKNTLQNAARRWMTAIRGDVPDYDFASGWSGTCGDQSFEISAGERIDDLRIYVTRFDGGGNLFGWAYPALLRDETLLPVLGCMGFDLERANLLITGRHEIGHVLGFGSIWSDFLKDPQGDPHFNGPQARAAFDAAGGGDYTGQKVPVESDLAHWRLPVLEGELMVAGGGGALSAVTVQSLADLGYEVDVTQADRFTLRTLAAAKVRAKVVASGSNPYDRFPGRGRGAWHPHGQPEHRCGVGQHRIPIPVVDPQGRLVRTLHR